GVRRAADGRHRFRTRPAGHADGRRGEHSRGDRVPQDPDRGLSADRRARRRLPGAAARSRYPHPDAADGVAVASLAAPGRNAPEPPRRPESVLVIVYVPSGETLLLKRCQPFGFWQSVTGSLLEGETHAAAAARELREETGFTSEGELTFSG